MKIFFISFPCFKDPQVLIIYPCQVYITMAALVYAVLYALGRAGPGICWDRRLRSARRRTDVSLYQR